MSETEKVLPERNLKQLSNERKIIWLDEPSKHEFVRETTLLTCRPKDFPTKKYKNLVGYEIKVKKDRRVDGLYERLYWFKKDYDNEAYGNGHYPIEAVCFK
jgi:hypothetical protein